MKLSAKSCGFTLPELLAVLIIASLLAGISINRYSKVSDFEGVMGTESLYSLVLGTQLLSFSRSGVDLFIQNTGSFTTFQTRVGGVVQTSRTFKKSEVAITMDTNSSDGISTCAEIIAAISIAYSSGSEIVGAYSNGTYSEGIAICVNGNTSICISPSGFPFMESCAA